MAIDSWPVDMNICCQTGGWETFRTVPVGARWFVKTANSNKTLQPGNTPNTSKARVPNFHNPNMPHDQRMAWAARTTYIKRYAPHFRRTSDDEKLWVLWRQQSNSNLHISRTKSPPNWGLKYGHYLYSGWGLWRTMKKNVNTQRHLVSNFRNGESL